MSTDIEKNAAQSTLAAFNENAKNYNSVVMPDNDYDKLYADSFLATTTKHERVTDKDRVDLRKKIVERIVEIRTN